MKFASVLFVQAVLSGCAPSAPVAATGYAPPWRTNDTVSTGACGPVSEEALLHDTVYEVFARFTMQNGTVSYAVMRPSASDLFPAIYRLDSIKLGDSRCFLVKRVDGKVTIRPYGCVYQ